MTDTNLPPQSESVSDPAESLTQHLLRNPCDLIDTRRLMGRFKASAADVLHALGRLEQLNPAGGDEPAAC
jgi:hypothetical protein